MASHVLRTDTVTPVSCTGGMLPQRRRVNMRRLYVGQEGGHTKV